MAKNIRGKVFIEGQDLDSESMNSVIKRIASSFESSVNQYNTVFRQASTNLIVAAGIMLALSTQLIGGLQGALLPVKIMATGIVVSLTLSIGFGIIQQLMEASFFRNHATRKINLYKKIEVGHASNADKVAGMLDEIDEQCGRAVSRWASVVQLVLLAMALTLIVSTTIYYLFI